MAALNDTKVLLSICEGIWAIEYEDSDLVNKFNDSILLRILARRDDVAKVKCFAEKIMPNMDDHDFRRHFWI
ncbi:hypothetical protein ACJMK2_008214 [Sinanodonta woodiana]|uniref:Uncharacterized protein n=1 Tax=Sinanodonta woodiana TaxID=1069815 RepID=A0ABD3VNV3_SINWO